MATKVALERVTKAYGRRGPVLDGVDLTIAEGELLSLVGPSGCGKSTLLDLIAGFERPTSGAVRIDGEIVDHRPPGERGVAMVFQSYALYPHLTVRGNLAFPLDVAGLDRASIAARVAETAARLELTGLLDRLPKQLSGGQRQRVALGRALVRRPRLCLFDEPLSNLDASLRGQMRAEIKKLHEELGATFVYVTHDQTEAMTMSDRVAILNRGKIQQIAPPREIYARPSNTFVAAFMGSPPINLLRGPAFAGGRALITGVRPHDVEVGAGEPTNGARAGRVYVVEPTGAETWVTLEIEGERVMGRAPADFAARSGDAAWALWAGERRVFFDPRTEARVDGP